MPISLIVLGLASQAFNVLKELDEAKEALEKKRGQLDEQIRAHGILQSCLEQQAIGDAAEVQPKFVQAQQQVKRLHDELRRREACCADLEDELNGMLAVDQARSAFRPTRLFPEEPTGNAQARPLLVEQEVAMHRHRSSVSNQASPSSITPDRPAGRTIPASPNPPPSIDEYGRLSKSELEAKIAKLTQRSCVSVFRNAGILTKYPNRDPGLKLVSDQLFEIAGWLLPDISLPGSIAGLVKLLRNTGILTEGGHNVKGSVELVQAAFDKNPEELAPAIQRVPWGDAHLHIQGLTDLLIRLGADEVREAYAQNKFFLERELLQKANRLTGAAPVAPAS
ncbi:hypothetical protein QJQ45_009188 [Haematococcus lacustris]|nr:hypothetical protein QJQ45_009188 [Haematococcus lacustris]